MSDRFYVGQRVRKKKLGGTADELPVGTIGTILMPRQLHKWRNGNIGFTYTTDVEDWFPTEPILEPLYDGDEKTAWSESAWKPMHLRGVSVKPPENVEAK